MKADIHSAEKLLSKPRQYMLAAVLSRAVLAPVYIYADFYGVVYFYACRLAIKHMNNRAVAFIGAEYS